MTVNADDEEKPWYLDPPLTRILLNVRRTHKFPKIHATEGQGG